MPLHLSKVDEVPLARIKNHLQDVFAMYFTCPGAVNRLNIITLQQSISHYSCSEIFWVYNWYNIIELKFLLWRMKK